MRTGGWTVVTVVLVAALLAGCGLRVGEDPPKTTPSPVPVADPEYLAVADNTHASLLGSRKFGDTNQGELVGPHFLMKQQSTGVVKEIDSDAAKKLGLPGPIRADDGYELVVADFTSSVDYGYDVPSSGRLPGNPKAASDPGFTQSIVVGTSTRKLRHDLTSGRLVIVSAPVGDKVSLRVTDSGRTQTLDLRSGKRVKDALTSYYPAQDWTPGNTSGNFGRDGSGYVGKDEYADLVDALLVEARATLSPFGPTGTWAGSGKAWLYVTVRIGSPCYEPYACQVRFTPGNEIRIALSNRVKPRVVGTPLWSSPMAEPAGDSGLATYAYEIPSSTKWAVVTMSFDGPLYVRKTTGGKTSKPFRVKWDEKPENPVALRFAPAAD